MNRKLGLTLIEILVVIAIIALILAFIPMHPPKTPQTNAKMLMVGSFLRTYYIEKQKWPDQEKWTEELKESGQEIEHWNSFFLDSWKNPIQYRIVEKEGIQTVLLYSFGKNKTDDNGTGDDVTRKIEPPTPEEIESYKKNQ